MGLFGFGEVETWKMRLGSGGTRAGSFVLSSCWLFFFFFLLFCSSGAVRKKDLQKEVGGKMASGE